MLGFKPKRKSLREQWHEKYERDRAGYLKLVSPEIERAPNPPRKALVSAQMMLSAALSLLYVKEEAATAEALLDRSIRVVLRQVLDRPESLRAKDKMDAERTIGYGSWLKTCEVDRSSLGRAYDAALLAAEEDADDRYFREGELLQAARIALIIGRPGDALTALERQASWSHQPHEQMRGALFEAADALHQNRRADLSGLDHVFRQYRCPYVERSAMVQGSADDVRFELAAIREVLLSNDGQVSLERLLGSVTAEGL